MNLDAIRQHNIQIVHEDANAPELRRIVTAELMEILEELNQCNLNIPVNASLAVWYEKFHDSLRLPNIEKTVFEFVRLLEDIFKDPRNNQVSYPPKLLDKIRDHHSPLFSEYIAEAVPLPVQKHVPNEYEEFAEQMRMIDAIYLQRKKQDEDAMEGLQKLRGRIQEIDNEERERLNAIGIRVADQLEQARQEIQKLDKEMREEAEQMLDIAKGLQQEVVQLEEEIVNLNEQIQDVRSGIHVIQKANIQLECAIKEVKADIKRRKSNWLKDVVMTIAVIGVSIAATWAVGALFPGAGANVKLIPRGVMAGFSKKF